MNPSYMHRKPSPTADALPIHVIVARQQEGVAAAEAAAVQAQRAADVAADEAAAAVRHAASVTSPAQVVQAQLKRERGRLRDNELRRIALLSFRSTLRASRTERALARAIVEGVATLA